MTDLAEWLRARLARTARLAGLPEGHLPEGHLAEGFLAEGFLAEGFLAEGFLAEGFLVLDTAWARRRLCRPGPVTGIIL